MFIVCRKVTSFQRFQMNLRKRELFMYKENIFVKYIYKKNVEASTFSSRHLYNPMQYFFHFVKSDLEQKYS